MLSELRDLSMGIPFMLAAGVAQPRISAQRIVEALLIAVITALATSYVTVQKLDLKLDMTSGMYQKQFDDQVKRRDAEINRLRAEMKESTDFIIRQHEALRVDIQKLALAVERKR